MPAAAPPNRRSCGPHRPPRASGRPSRCQAGWPSGRAPSGALRWRRRRVRRRSCRPGPRPWRCRGPAPAPGRSAVRVGRRACGRWPWPARRPRRHGPGHPAGAAPAPAGRPAAPEESVPARGTSGRAWSSLRHRRGWFSAARPAGRPSSQSRPGWASPAHLRPVSTLARACRAPPPARLGCPARHSRPRRTTPGTTAGPPAGREMAVGQRQASNRPLCRLRLQLQLQPRPGSERPRRGRLPAPPPRRSALPAGHAPGPPRRR